jgi:photosystem II stability/assembly factor-like uncharacterized protein
MKLPLALLVAGFACAQSWIPQKSGVSASLRGVSAAGRGVVWASGTAGTYLLSANGGATWRAAQVPGAADLDFRAVHAIDGRTAYLLASGPGDKSRIYKTTDGGAHWTLQFTNPDPGGFLDAFGFWDASHGVALGDPVSGAFSILTTSDGGAHWTPRPGPKALPLEGAFAASGTCLIVTGRHECWFATGGPGAARVFHSNDDANTWVVASAPLRNDGASAGIFSLGFSSSLGGIAVGGDFKQLAEISGNIAVTADGGKTWAAPRGRHPNGYRSAVAYLAKAGVWIAVGTSGSDLSLDAGESWTQFDTAAYNAMSFTPDGSGWAVGPQGKIAEFRAGALPSSGR